MLLDWRYIIDIIEKECELGLCGIVCYLLCYSSVDDRIEGIVVFKKIVIYNSIYGIVKIYSG